MFTLVTYRKAYHNGDRQIINIDKTGWFSETWVVLAGGRAAMLVQSVRVPAPVLDKAG